MARYLEEKLTHALQGVYLLLLDLFGMRIATFRRIVVSAAVGSFSAIMSLLVAPYGFPAMLFMAIAMALVMGNLLSKILSEKVGLDLTSIDNRLQHLQNYEAINRKALARAALEERINAFSAGAWFIFGAPFIALLSLWAGVFLVSYGLATLICMSLPCLLVRARDGDRFRPLQTVPGAS